MNHSLRASIAALAIVAIGASGAFADEITVKHAQGETVLPDTPKTVITYDLAALDTLDALGVDVAGIPDATLPDYLSKYSDVEKVGSLFEPDFEAVNALQPDLIIVAARSSKQYGPLSQIAPTIDVTNDWANFVPSIEQNTRIVADIFGKQAEADKLIANLDAKVKEVSALTADAGTALVVMTNGGKVTDFGPGSRYGWLYDTLGFKPAETDVKAETHGDAVSFEYLLNANPDWFIVIDRDAGVTGENLAEATLDNELVAQTKAWKEGHVIYLEPVRSYIVNGGIQSITDQVEQVRAALAD